MCAARVLGMSEGTFDSTSEFFLLEKNRISQISTSSYIRSSLCCFYLVCTLSFAELCCSAVYAETLGSHFVVDSLRKQKRKKTNVRIGFGFYSCASPRTKTVEKPQQS